MTHFNTNSLLVAFIGFLISWFIHLSGAYAGTIKKEEDRFHWGFYFRKNVVDIITAFLSTIILLFLIPIALDSFDIGVKWSTPMAAGCGVSNVQIVKILKKLFEKKIVEKTGIEIEENDKANN